MASPSDAPGRIQLLSREFEMRRQTSGIKIMVAAAAVTGGLSACATDEIAGTDELAQASELGGFEKFAGHVYVMTNDPQNNAIIHYGRRPNGQLVQLGSTLTQGHGSGLLEVPDLTVVTPDPLQSQQALRLTADQRFLMAVNTIDHTVTVFRVEHDGVLTVSDVQDSGGTFPNTISVHGRLVYVGNIGNPPQGIGANVSGFILSDGGRLIPIPGSTRALPHPEISLPAHVLFSEDGRSLVVSDLNIQELDVFPVREDGRLGSPTITPSVGPHPFGMAFAREDVLLVSESGEFTGSSVTSYRLRGTHLDVISPAVPNGQAGGCWLSVTPNDRFLFSGNTFAPGTVSTYSLSRTGALGLVFGPGAERTPDPRVGTTAPLDSFVTRDGRFMYQHFGGLGVVGAFRVGADGLLTPISGGDGGGLPLVGSQGLDGF
jgi:6-phosphogluconolactonase (cycloisomerase 2 family)